jgi:fungal STAND N-terminal Goodbye domain
MNAVSYLIETGTRYKHIFSSLENLFTRISAFLERFQIYYRMTDVDIALRKIINDSLICFVSICELSTKVLRSNKVALYLNVFLFSHDEGVASKLNEYVSLRNIFGGDQRS